MTLFDAYVFVDWSARNAPSPAAPSPDAIWVGELGAGGEAGETYHRSRAAATLHVRELLVGHVDRNRRVLVGFDFPYGYPAGLAAGLALGGAAPWRATWDLLGGEIEDDEHNRSNRFAVAAGLNERLGAGPGPFWGCPPAQAGPCLTSRMNGLVAYPYALPGGALGRWRRTEAAMTGVQETWRLAGAGSVGSQALVGIPRVRALRDDPELRDVSSVWPFETGFTPRPAPGEGPWVLHAEIWPGIIEAAAVAREATATDAIRDQAQVRLMCRWARDRDRDGTLGAWFDAAGLDPAVKAIAVAEEGWILGCPAWERRARANISGRSREAPRAAHAQMQESP